MEFTNKIFSPKALFKEQVLYERELKLVKRYRQIARRVFAGEDTRIPVIVGPCSIHSIKGALKYAENLKQLFEEVSETLFPIMRVYVEKPRTTIGWKGLLYDPYLNGTNDIAAGIRSTRALLIKLARMGVPAATEFVSPITALYFKDLITWGFIGARTTASQVHREFAASVNFPIGFKNNTDGNLQIAIDSVISARTNHTYLSLDKEGTPTIVEARGNPFTHLVLRGSDIASNYDTKSVEHANYLQKKCGLFSKILVDCAHGNSKRNPSRQKEVFFEVAEEIAQGNANMLGLMLESYLEGGSQSFDHTSSMIANISITDPCISWDDTESLLRWLHNSLSKKSTLAFTP